MSPNSKQVTARNSTTVWIVAIAAIVLVIAMYFAVDLLKGRQRCFDCGDGKRCTIDVRQFETQYSAYSLELEISIRDQGKFSTKLNPVQLQTLTEAMQSANEFRKYVVSGFNSCAITKEQYAQMGQNFQAIDNIAHEISDLTRKSTLTPQESTKLSGLIQQYRELLSSLPKG